MGHVQPGGTVTGGPVVVLVRHAMPLIDADLQPGEWRLSPEGVLAARALATELPTGATALASGERKAQETLQHAGCASFMLDAGFGEVRRPREPVGPDAVEPRGAWIAGRVDERHTGWERQSQVAERFEQAIRDAPEGDLIVASHGMCLTTWLVHRGHVAPGDHAARFWERLGLPDVITVPR